MKLIVILLVENNEVNKNLEFQTFQDFRILCLQKGIDKTSLLNNALRQSKEDYLVILDSHVSSQPNRFQKQIDLLNQRQITATGTAVNVLVDDKAQTVHYPSSSVDCYADFYRNKKDFVFDLSVMMRKEDVIEAGGFTSYVRESEEKLDEAIFLSLWCRLMLCGKQIHNLDEPLVSCPAASFPRSPQYEKEKNLVWGMFRRKTFKIKPLDLNVSSELFGNF